MLEGLAWERFRRDGHPERFRGKVAILVPAYNEAREHRRRARRIPAEVCGRATAVLVVDDGSRDGTGDVAEAAGAVVARHVINRGGGAALRTGYRLLADSEANIVVTLDADGQHLPSEMPRLVEPVLSGEVDDGPRLARPRRGRAEHRARELGIVFFNRVVSFITRTKVTDCSNGYRAVRARRPPQLVLRQEQFHTSEFMIEAIKRGIPAKEVPVTVVAASTATRRSRPWCATGWASRTRSSGPGCVRGQWTFPSAYPTVLSIVSSRVHSPRRAAR